MRGDWSYLVGMSREDHPDVATEFALSELRGEGVDISEETVRRAARQHFAKPVAGRARVPRGFEPRLDEPFAETGT